jgi:hypothetical protein
MGVLAAVVHGLLVFGAIVWFGGAIALDLVVITVCSRSHWPLAGPSVGP